MFKSYTLISVLALLFSHCFAKYESFKNFIFNYIRILLRQYIFFLILQLQFKFLNLIHIRYRHCRNVSFWSDDSRISSGGIRQNRYRDR